MDVTVTQGSIQEATADTIVVNLFQGVKAPGGATGAVDRDLNGTVSDLIGGGDFTGKLGEVAVLYPRGAIPARRVLLAGLGAADQFGAEEARTAAAAAIKKARALRAEEVATIIHGGGIGGMEIEMAAQATLEGTLLALYRYEATRKEVAEESHNIAALHIVEFDAAKIPAIQEAARHAQALTAGVTLARDLVNAPPNRATPSYMAEIAGMLAADYGFEILIGDREWATAHKMGAFLAVASGAGEPPRFIVLEHNAGRTDLDTVILAGKGITFDTGGISLKPVENMGDMKSDMAGAAAVLGTMKVVGMLDLPLHIVAIAPCTENMPDGLAYRPADVITASNGTTIEIISTDAEGRMVLADGLSYAARYAPQAVVDLATLTGSSIIALGRNVAAGLFSTDHWLEAQLMSAAERTHERLWPLPLWPDYREAIRSDVADVKNSGGRYGGVGTSAIFLKTFTSYPWAHLDIAGVATRAEEAGYTPAGATGFGVRLLTDFLRNWQRP
jgi:leucyl aminopeptidase